MQITGTGVSDSNFKSGIIDEMNAQELNDLYLRCLVLWREARGSSKPTLAAINAVIHNRMTDERNRWPKNAAEVILQPFQFSSFNKTDPNSTKLPSHKYTLDWNAWQDCVDTVMTPMQSDPTNGATNFHSTDVQPPWADPSKMTVQIGAFKFYRL